MERIRKYSPYLLIELLLPGGTLIALLLWLFRRQQAKSAGPSLHPTLHPSH